MSDGYMPIAKSVEWETPQDLFNKLNTEFNFTVDVAASDTNNKCLKYYTEQTDGLKQNWRGETVWCNPPYGKQIADWVKKAHNTVIGDHTVTTTCVFLVPARTDVRWFHEYIYDKSEIRFLKGRLKFNGSKTAAPFPNMIVIFRSNRTP